VGAEERHGPLGVLELTNIHQYLGKRPRIFGMVSKKKILAIDSFQSDGLVQSSTASAGIVRIGQSASCLHERDDLRPCALKTLAESNWRYR
jgi:hypothetical protein